MLVYGGTARSGRKWEAQLNQMNVRDEDESGRI